MSDFAAFIARNKWYVAGFGAVVVAGAIVGGVVGSGVLSTASNQSTAPPPSSEADPPLPPTVWQSFQDVTYPQNTVQHLHTATQDACRDSCGLGCDFYTYRADTRQCDIKFTDKTAYIQTLFAGQQAGSVPVSGQLRNTSAVTTNTTATSAADCHAKCVAAGIPACHLATFDTGRQNECLLKSLLAAPGTVLGYRANPPPFNTQPRTMGRMEVIGSSGVVTIHATLMPNGKLLFGARPEYFRNGPNTEVVVRAQVPYGEISTVFDPVTATFVASPIDDNVFCHGAVLAEDGRVFQAGGDDTADISRGPGVGLVNGLNKMRYFDYRTGQWNLEIDMIKPRWYPSVARLVDGSYFVLGGMVNGLGEPQPNLEVFRPGQPNTTLVPSPIMDFTGTCGYPKVAMVPGTGHIFMFTSRRWTILNKQDGTEMERDLEPVRGYRSGDWPTAGTLLPLSPITAYRAEYIIFGGSDSLDNQTAIDDVARVTITDPVGAKQWRYDSGRMPYGRIVSDAVLQPNGKVLIFNGGRLGKTGGSADAPGQSAAAGDCFCYDPEAPDGQRWRVFAGSPIQRFYHSAALLVPDGRSLISGTDQATFDRSTAYEHRVEAFTPPWLLDGTPRPQVTQPLSTDSVIKYGTTFTIQYSGAVTNASIMTPGSTTHGTEFTQRLFFPTIVSKTATSIELRAPPDATVLLQGYHMVFLLNRDTPSVAQWIRLGA